MITKKQKDLVDNMSLADLKYWIHSTFGNGVSENKELKDYMIKTYYEKYGNV